MKRARKEDAKILRRYSEALKLKAVQAIDAGEMNQSEAARAYGCTKGAVNQWMKKYSKNRQRIKVVHVAMKDEQDRIRELESALAKAHMKLEVYEKMMEYVRDEDGIEVKKNTDTGELEIVRRGVGSKGTVKRSE